MEFLATILTQGSIPVILLVLGFAAILLANVSKIGPVVVTSGKGSFLSICGTAMILTGLGIYLYETYPYRPYETIEEVDTGSRGVQNVKITSIHSYSQYGKGDVTFKINGTFKECPDGLWLKPTDPGFSSNLKLVILAKSLDLSVHVYGLPDQTWPGTRGIVCHLYAIFINMK